jgi:hypothetical protein
LAQGTHKEKKFGWQDSNNVNIDLTNYDARCQCRPFIESPTISIELNKNNGGITVGDGFFQLNFTPAHTSPLSDDKLSYDVEIISPTGKVTRPVKGTITLDKENTR